MEAKYELIAEYMTKRTQELDVNGEQTGIVNWFLMSKEEQIADFEAFMAAKTARLEIDKQAIAMFAADQIAEADAKLEAVVEIGKGLPEPIVGKLPEEIIIEELDAVVVEEIPQ